MFPNPPKSRSSLAQNQMQSDVESAAVPLVSSRRFVSRLVISSISSLAVLISLILIGPTVYRIAAFDPALEAFYVALLVGWFGSLGGCGFSPTEIATASKQPQLFTPHMEERRAKPCQPA
jgi:hypothetical protein